MMNTIFVSAYRGLAGRCDKSFEKRLFIFMRFALQYPLQYVIYQVQFSTAKYAK